MDILGAGWEALRDVRLLPLALGLAIHAGTDCVRNGAWLAILLAMALEGATRVRLAPATSGLRVAALTAAFTAAGSPVAPAAVAAYVIAVQTGRTVVALAIGVPVAAATLRVRHPRRAVAALRKLTESRSAPVAAPALEQAP